MAIYRKYEDLTTEVSKKFARKFAKDYGLKLEDIQCIYVQSYNEAWKMMIDLREGGKKANCRATSISRGEVVTTI